MQSRFSRHLQRHVGSNVDFCTGPLAHPVRCRAAPNPRGAYPYSDGHLWGEPDLEHAAALMQPVAARHPSRDPAVLAGVPEAVLLGGCRGALSGAAGGAMGAAAGA